MGMGGGFYDRTFEYKHKSPHAKPRLIGLAHDLQKQEELPINNWDVSLDAIVTDKNLYASRY
jgi:5-formyltetrahydrofolate cyclo-ligase